MNVPPKEKKATPLSVNVPVVKSPALAPAIRQSPDYAEFDEFVKIADRMVSGYERVRDIGEAIDNAIDENKPLERLIERAQYVLREKNHYLQLHKQFLAYERIYNDEKRFYEKGGKWVIQKRIVTEKVAVLIGSFPNAKPHSPEVYSRALVEEVIAAKPHAIVLESACRHLRRDKKYKFLPAISEVLEVIDEQGSLWCPRWEAGADENDEGGGIPWAFQRLESLLPEAKAVVEKRKAEAEAEAARNRSQVEANEARRKAEAEAAAARKKAEAEAEAARIKAEAEKELAEFQVDLDRKVEEIKSRCEQEKVDIQAAYIRGRDFGKEYPSRPLKDQLRESLIIYGCGSTREKHRISFAFGLFEMRRELQAWRHGWARGKYGVPIWQ
jgi:hypothetical protein